MPSSPKSRKMAANLSDAKEDRLRPYKFHGIVLTQRGSHSVGICPFCHREDKFSVDNDTGLWRCFVCAAGTPSGGGNSLVFLRLLYEYSLTASSSLTSDFLEVVALDRKLLFRDTVRSWGVCESIIDGSWLVPGYGPNGKLNQLYKRINYGDKSKLLPTPGIWKEGKAHALYTSNPSCFSSTYINICEGPWDGMALWELTNSKTDSAIICVPGCNTWKDEWSEICRNKFVTIWFDSDHPIKEALNQGKVLRPGYDSTIRLSKKLSGIAASVTYLKWGEEGYDPLKPSGWDIRDHLSQKGNIDDRKVLLSQLSSKLETAPTEWFIPNQNSGASTNNLVVAQSDSIETLFCDNWKDCESAWSKAMRWRQDLSDALAVTLAACASTKQGGNQLFVDLVGSPGVAKTTILRGALVSSNCVHVENITKLMSGYKKPGEENTDCSFLARANNKTWITCEFDTVLSSPQYTELMGKMRRIFDGETSSTYGNSNEDRIYRALRTPWVRAGTWKMMDQDQSQLGDRFVRLIINDPTATEKRNIVRSAIRSERAAILESSNGTTGSILDPGTRIAYSLTGGYIDWLRANVEEYLPKVVMSEEAEDVCIDLAELSADLRARPSVDKKGAVNDSFNSKELPTRLARQNVRLAICLAVIQNKTHIDHDILRIVNKVAFDTAYGHTLNIVKWLCSPNPKAPNKTYQESGGFMEGILGQWTGMHQDKLLSYLMFLRNIEVLQCIRIASRPTSWILTDRVYDLYLRIIKRGY